MKGLNPITQLAGEDIQRKMKNIKKITIENEEIYLKKSGIFGWGIVYPYKINGKINWKNLLIGGSWIKLIIILFAVLIILGCINEYSTAVKIANECLAKPEGIKYYLPL